MTRKTIFAIIAVAGIMIFGLQISLAQEGGMNSNVHKGPAKAIPEWVDNNFKWYGEGLIEQSDLLNSMKFLLDNGHMHLSDKAAQEVKMLRTENAALKKKLEFDGMAGAKTADIPAHTPEWTNQNDSDPGMTKAGMNGAHIIDQNGMSHGFILAPTDVDINALVQQVLRESYNENNKDLQFYAEKVKYYNDMKKAVRDHLDQERNEQMMAKQTAKSDFGTMMKSGMTASKVSPSQTKVIVMGMISDGHSYAKKQIGQMVKDGQSDPQAWKKVFSDMQMHTMKHPGYNELKMDDTAGTTDSTIDELQGVVVLCNTALDSEIQSLHTQVELMKELTAMHQDDTTADYSTRTSADPAQDVDGAWWGEKLNVIDKKTKSLQTALNVCQEKSRELDVAIKQLEGELSSVGEDAQLANIDLQNNLQKQQQTLQTISNVSKMLHDTAMAVIRKIG